MLGLFEVSPVNTRNSNELIVSRGYDYPLIEHLGPGS